MVDFKHPARVWTECSPEAPAASGEPPYGSGELGCHETVFLGCHGTIFSSRFGEPVPGLVTLPVVAPFTSAVATCAGVAEVWPAR